MKNIIVKEEKGYFLWTYETFEENIGIVWEKEYADLIQRALKFYNENYKE